MLRFSHYTISACLLVMLHSGLTAQKEDSLMIFDADEILLYGNRTYQALPWTHFRDTLRSIDVMQSSLRSAFNRQPGLQAFNGENFAQDIRIAVRGFGGRAAFGIRGIKMYMDGIPLTSPDGTTQLDELSQFDVSSIQVLRSGMAARLGNASGGAISLQSPDFFSGIRLQSSISSNDAYNLGVKHGTKKDRLSNVISVNHHYFNGRREYSTSRNTTIYNKLRYIVNDKFSLNILAGGYHSPTGDDPGSLKLEDFNTNRYQANAANLKFRAGESVSGFLSAIQSVVVIKESLTWKSNVFYKKRIFEARLPFENGGYIKLDRNFGGFGHSFDWNMDNRLHFTLGQTMEFQRDKRSLFQNSSGILGRQVSDQIESVFNHGIYQQMQWKTGRFHLHQLIRWDMNKYELSDLFQDDGIQNGNILYRNINFAIGGSIQTSAKLQWYSNISTAFEMPTLNELSNNPLNLTGFNTSLKPERSLQAEIGMHWNPIGRLDIRTTMFYILLKDLITPYELETVPSKTFYRNVSEANRKGIELTASYRIKTDFSLLFNYTFSDFRYTRYTLNNSNLKGKYQPLIPRHKANILFVYNGIRYLETNLILGFSSPIYLDDLNQKTVASTYECSMMLSSNERVSKRFTYGINVNNMFGLMQYSNFRANAAAQRYYEAASPKHAVIFIRTNLSKN